MVSDHFVLLSRWKQMTATMMYNYYVLEAFSNFDSRTTNIDRAVEDLEPLLRLYADDHVDSPRNNARLHQLKEVLQSGARFAFTMFSQPGFWRFDWDVEDGSKGGERKSDRGEIMQF